MGEAVPVVFVDAALGRAGAVDGHEQPQRLARHLARVLHDGLPEDEGPAADEDGDRVQAQGHADRAPAFGAAAADQYSHQVALGQVHLPLA